MKVWSFKIRDPFWQYSPLLFSILEGKLDGSFSRGRGGGGGGGGEGGSRIIMGGGGGEVHGLRECFPCAPLPWINPCRLHAAPACID